MRDDQRRRWLTRSASAAAEATARPLAHDGPVRPLPTLLLRLGAVLAAGGAASALTGGNAAVTWSTSVVGSAVVVEHLAARRRRGAAAHPQAGLLDTAAVTMPAERFAVGSALQSRLHRATRRVWAPGVLGVSADSVVFVPSKGDRADRLWWTPSPRRVEVMSLAGRSTIVRVHGGDRVAQFAVLAPLAHVEPALAAVLPVARGLTDPDPGATRGRVPPPRPYRPMDPIPDFAAVDAEARRRFGADGDAAVEVIARYGAEPHHREPERVRTVALILADGDLDRLRRLIDLANVDYRDVLAAYEDRAAGER